MAEVKAQKKYFIAKVNNFQSLKQAVQTGQWACANRTTPPHPRDILSQAFSQGIVVIIFSVSNCHGWHGYAEMINIPTEAPKNTELPGEAVDKSKDISKATDISNNTDEASQLSESNIESQMKTEDTSTASEKTDRAVTVEVVNDCVSNQLVRISKPENGEWAQIAIKGENEISPSKSSKYHHFDINWKLNYLDFGEQCLSSKLTENLFCIENPSGNKIQVNKCRNWQELDAKTGGIICQKMEEFYDSLCKKREERKQKETECQAEPFYKETKVLTVQETWMKIVTQVENELGTVLLACPFGSQRYNLDTPDSDTDMFIVYQAKTRDILSFHPPKQTIKNHESESCDYTIHEVYRYCELLLSGDARCVETLFLQESTVVQASSEWQALKQGRKMFLNKECLEKYLRDAQGSKGTKYLQKWCTDHPQELVLPAKMCKMLYVIVRLLQNARFVRIFVKTGHRKYT